MYYGFCSAMASMNFFLKFLIFSLVTLIVSGNQTKTERPGCDDGSTSYEFKKRINTTDRLEKLRNELRRENISAYIILSEDEHQSEYVGDHDKRREYISGFTGSAGDAVVTLDSAALWTDSRYYIQAENQLDCNWVLMKTGETETPNIATWITQQLHPGDLVSSDPKIVPFQDWLNWNSTLASNNLSLTITENLVDRIWGEADNRPPYPSVPLMVLDLQYAGVAWQEKLKQLKDDMRGNLIDTLIITALDETAWTLNLRGGDVPYTPVFRSYLVINLNYTTLYLPSEKLSEEIIEYLNANGSEPGDSVRIKDYNDIWNDLPEMGQNSTKIGLPTPYVYSGGASYLVYSSLPHDKIKTLISPALLRKDVKNVQEIIAMRNSHIKDAVALCQFFAKMEEEIASGNNWTELSAAYYLDSLRSQQNTSFGPSFETISAFGVHAAMPHYSPTGETDAVIDTSALYLVDSGGQYLGGTTDVTRTVHFGTPRQIEKEVYTRLLKGCIDIASVTFKEGYKLKDLEILIRANLYEAGLDYGHGSTHGIGSFLAVHESFNDTWHINFFGSQEPGYYKENDFGMRLENIIAVIESNVSNPNQRFLTFDTITLVPYEQKLIITDMLDKKHVKWLNEYHEKIRVLVGEELQRQGLTDVYNWLVDKTEPIYV